MFTAEHLISRSSGKDSNFNPKVPDFLQYFLNAKNTHPDLVDDGIIMGYLLVNLLAGADTTAITIRAIFYYALRNPEVYKKMEAEIVAADFAKVAPYNAARALPCESPNYLRPLLVTARAYWFHENMQTSRPSSANQ